MFPFKTFVPLLVVGMLSNVAFATPPGYRGTPFGDAVHAAAPQRIPGPVFCAYYDRGGEGVAYHDVEAQNLGSGRLNPLDGSYLNEFRANEGVDISYTKQVNDLESPCNRVTPPLGLLYVGWTEPGEWFNLTVDVAEAGSYVVDILYTSNRGADIGIDRDGVPIARTHRLQSTFDERETIAWRQWHHWAVDRSAVAVELPKGRSVLTVRIVNGGNINLATFYFRRGDVKAERDAVLKATTPTPTDGRSQSPAAAKPKP